MSRRISAERKASYYAGMALMVLGGLTFASVFVSGAMNAGDFSNFDSQMSSTMIRAVAGMALLVVGGILRTTGQRGLAGSGVLLDSERARDELEPYTRMAGGMVNDLLDEADIELGSSKEQVVMIRCRACSKLNEEDSKFCQECGEPI